MFNSITAATESAINYATDMGFTMMEVEYFRAFHFPTQKYFYEFSFFGLGETTIFAESKKSGSWSDIESFDKKWNAA